jgi:hypothetical protein
MPHMHVCILRIHFGNADNCIANNVERVLYYMLAFYCMLCITCFVLLNDALMSVRITTDQVGKAWYMHTMAWHLSS